MPPWISAVQIFALYYFLSLSSVMSIFCLVISNFFVLFYVFLMLRHFHSYSSVQFLILVLFNLVFTDDSIQIWPPPGDMNAALFYWWRVLIQTRPSLLSLATLSIFICRVLVFQNTLSQPVKLKHDCCQWLTVTNI